MEQLAYDASKLSLSGGPRGQHGHHGAPRGGAWTGAGTVAPGFDGHAVQVPVWQQSNNEETPPGCNIFIRGLKADATDELLTNLCSKYGVIVSAKAIIDRDTHMCKGYGFVLFERQDSAAAAITGLNNGGPYEAAYAKMSSWQGNNTGESAKDPTNLYFSNLPETMTDQELQEFLQPFGSVVSSRILRDYSTGASRGVGFARMESKAICETIIVQLNGRVLAGCTEPLLCKFADSPHARKRGPNRWMWYPAQMMPGMYPQAEMLQEVVPTATRGQPMAVQYAGMPTMPMYAPTQVVYDSRGRPRPVPMSTMPYIPATYPQFPGQLVYSSQPVPFAVAPDMTQPDVQPSAFHRRRSAETAPSTVA